MLVVRVNAPPAVMPAILRFARDDTARRTAFCQRQMSENFGSAVTRSASTDTVSP